MSTTFKLLIALACFLLTGCRSAKIASNRQKSIEQVSSQVEVKKQESTLATVATTIQEEAKREGFNSWSIALSADSDAVPFSFMLPDGSVVVGRGKNISGTGKLTENRTTSTQQQSTEQRQAKSDSTAKHEIKKSEKAKAKSVERKASSLWPLTVAGIGAFVISFLYFYFKPRKS